MHSRVYNVKAKMNNIKQFCKALLQIAKFSIIVELIAIALISFLISGPLVLSEEGHSLSIGVNSTRYARTAGFPTAYYYNYFVVDVSIRNIGNKIADINYRSFTLYYECGGRVHTTGPDYGPNHPTNFHPLSSGPLALGQTVSGEVAFSLMNAGTSRIPTRLVYEYGNEKIVIVFEQRS
jgi:hypothetical protein